MNREHRILTAVPGRLPIPVLSHPIPYPMTCLPCPTLPYPALPCPGPVLPVCLYLPSRGGGQGGGGVNPQRGADGLRIETKPLPQRGLNHSCLTVRRTGSRHTGLAQQKTWIIWFVLWLLQGRGREGDNNTHAGGRSPLWTCSIRPLPSTQVHVLDVSRESRVDLYSRDDGTLTTTPRVERRPASGSGHVTALAAAAGRPSSAVLAWHGSRLSNGQVPRSAWHSLTPKWASGMGARACLVWYQVVALMPSGLPSGLPSPLPDAPHPQSKDSPRTHRRQCPRIKQTVPPAAAAPIRSRTVLPARTVRTAYSRARAWPRRLPVICQLPCI